MAGKSGVHATSITAAELEATHPALVGAGERAAAGLSPRHEWLGGTAPANQVANALISATGQAAPAMGVNMLLGGMGPQPAPGALVNQLTGTVTPSPSPPPSAAMLPPPAAPPGQAASIAIGKATGAQKMSDADLSKGFDRLEYIRSALGNMTRQSSPPTHDDVLAAVAKAVKDGIFPAAEAGQIMGGLTSDPAKLPAELEQRHKFALHQMVHLAGEMQKRTDAAKLGAS